MPHHFPDPVKRPDGETAKEVPAPIEPQNPLRVLHVITSLNRGGAESMLLQLVRAGRPAGTQSVAVLISGGDLVPMVRAAGVPLIELGLSRKYPNPLGVLRLALFIRRHRPNVVQGWMYHGDLTALLALWLSGRRGRTALFWGVRCSDMDLSRYGRVLRMIVRLCARLSPTVDGVIANSDAGRRVHEALGYAPPRFHVVPNGIDCERFRPDPGLREAVRAELGIAPDARVILHVARVDPMKDHEGLLQAAARVQGLILVLVGRGTDTLPAQDGVIALGLRDDVPRLLCAGDGIVLSSAFGEGFPNALAEGMAAGLAPITTDTGDSAMIAGETGWVVSPNDPEALADALRIFSKLPAAELEARRSAARASIRTRFSIARTAEQFQEIYMGSETEGGR
jgi:glycosyltransferase involved in cell wall biosynthesis